MSQDVCPPSPKPLAPEAAQAANGKLSTSSQQRSNGREAGGGVGGQRVAGGGERAAGSGQWGGKLHHRFSHDVAISVRNTMDQFLASVSKTV